MLPRGPQNWPRARMTCPRPPRFNSLERAVGNSYAPAATCGRSGIQIRVGTRSAATFDIPSPRPMPPEIRRHTAEYAAFLSVELTEKARLPGEILPRRRGIAVMAAVGEEQEIDAVGIGGAIRRNLD